MVIFSSMRTSENDRDVIEWDAVKFRTSLMRYFAHCFIFNVERRDITHLSKRIFKINRLLAFLMRQKTVLPKPFL